MPLWTSAVQGITTVLNAAGTALQRRKTIQFSTGLDAVDDGTKTVVSASSSGASGRDITGGKIVDEFMGGGNATSDQTGGLGELNWSCELGVACTAGSTTTPNSTSNKRATGIIGLKGAAGASATVYFPAVSGINNIRVKHIRAFECLWLPVLPTGIDQAVFGLAVDVSSNPVGASEALFVRARPDSSTELQINVRNASSTTPTNLGYTFSAGSTAVQAAQNFIATRIQQQVDGVTGLGTNVWDIYVNDFDTPVEADLAGPAVWDSSPDSVAHLFMDARGALAFFVCDYAGIEIVEQTLAQRISTP